MISMNIILDGDNAWPELKDAEIILPEGTLQVAILTGGLASGRPSVAIRIDLPDGRHVIAQTTARLFVSAGRAIVARHPDLFDDGPQGKPN